MICLDGPAICSKKVYVAVQAEFDTMGNMRPRSVLWKDGTRYEIDRVTNVCHAASSKAGGHGDRYTVLIGGQATYLFFERKFGCGENVGRWFVAERTTSF